MESTLKDLLSLLIQAIPTILFFVLLTVYLNAMFFKPLARVLEERRKQTEGVRDLAQKAFEAADRKTSQFERALEEARSQLHAEHEAQRRRWAEEEAAKLAAARQAAEHTVAEARQQIAAESSAAGQQLQGHVEALSQAITDKLLRRSAA